MNRKRLSLCNQTLFALGTCLILSVLMVQLVQASSTSTSIGSLELSITSPATLPPGFILNPGGINPGNFSFPDSGNSGNGTFSGMGTANCTPKGCTSPAADTNLQYQLTTDLTCNADSIGIYGGLEDSFALFGSSNMTGGSVTLDLRFTSSWSISTIVDHPPISDTAETSIDLLWAVPSDFCIALTSCPTGFLSGGNSNNCPSGFIEGTTLVLGSGFIGSNMGTAIEAEPVSICNVTVVVLANASSGGDLSVTSSCLASSNDIIFVNSFD